MTDPQENLALVREYLQAVERFATGDELAAFFAPDVVQQEFPNRFFAHGMKRDLAAILEGAERGEQLLSKQNYEIKNIVADGDRVALEVRWRGTIKVAAAGLEPGTELIAHLGVFLKLKDGKIVAQHNYDCYEPW